MIGIYKFTNKITGQSYIGQSVDIKRRYNQHKNRYDEFGDKEAPLEDTYFHSMLRHYGFHNFDFEILEECNKEDLNDKEIYYIAFYNSLKPNGYNQTHGGNEPHTNALSSLSDVESIINLLQNSDYSNMEIGKMFGISDQMVSDINNGRSWKKDGITYPIAKRKGRKKRTYYCKSCGAMMLDKTKTGFCYTCYLSDIAKHIPSKDKLYMLLSKNSFESVARMFGVSSNTIRKWCDRHDIPRHSKYYKIGCTTP